MRSAFFMGRLVRAIFQQRISLLLCSLIFASPLFAQDEEPKTPEDLKREAAIAQFTQKMQEANYPALFEKAAAEFHVPVEVLEGVSFAETRWEHMQWPPGETVSPDNGMPRPYGIMSLWDNQYFGHSLLDAAKLIGKSPDDLKNDPLDNIRGAAALMRKIYDANAKPDFAKDGELESWFNAVSKYSGIPQPELNSQHAFDVYRHLDAGYDQYGIKMTRVPNLKLEAMAAEVARIKAKAAADKENSTILTPEQFAAKSTAHATAPNPALEIHPLASSKPAASALAEVAPAPIASSNHFGVIVALVLGGGILLFLTLRKQTNSTKKV